jgi:two-component system chemotaxis response regulator CheY
MAKNAKKKKASVLIVDDDALMREVLRTVLREGEFDVVGDASNGEDAADLCAKLKPDVVLLDINMPRLDGIDGLARIRANSPACKVIMISSAATVDRVRDAVAGGAAGFIVKPFNAGRVLQEIEDLLRK